MRAVRNPSIGIQDAKVLHAIPLRMHPRRCIASASHAALACNSSNAAASAQLRPLQVFMQHASRDRLQNITCNAGFGFGAGAKAAAKSKECPCGSGKQYTECCQRFIKPKNKMATPETPEQLIAARYSAYCVKDAKFLKRTNHRNNPALQGSKTAEDSGVQKRCTYEEDMAMTFLSVDFLNFEIMGSSSSSGGDGSGDGSRSSSGSSATLDYAVTFKLKIDNQGQKITDPKEQVLCERATVVKDEDGKWVVLGVEQVQPASAAA